MRILILALLDVLTAYVVKTDSFFISHVLIYHRSEESQPFNCTYLKKNFDPTPRKGLTTSDLPVTSVLVSFKPQIRLLRSVSVRILILALLDVLATYVVETDSFFISHVLIYHRSDHSQLLNCTYLKKNFDPPPRKGLAVSDLPVTSVLISLEPDIGFLRSFSVRILILALLDVLTTYVVETDSFFVTHIYNIPQIWGESRSFLRLTEKKFDPPPRKGLTISDLPVTCVLVSFKPDIRLLWAFGVRILVLTLFDMLTAYVIKADSFFVTHDLIYHTLDNSQKVFFD